MFVNGHQVISRPAWLREVPLQKLIKRLQVLDPPVLTRSHLAQIPSHLHELDVPVRFASTRRSQARISSIFERTNIARRGFSLDKTVGWSLRKLIKHTNEASSRPADQLGFG